ncbi:hypothetical protein TEA_006931 [Camellia sinensis var. sinensis]|uniref:Uncharacterized protein n=1 Tax=Camellia sinensis var. sinensis TaxID=542762 RepID=A0A4S4DC12_CAMSN|nr:hypothetical protein TEA_006931 [Camellia sinensis var. sinensis]
MAKRLIPTFNRVLVEKIVPPSKTTAGILLPEKSSKLNSGKVVAVGPGMRDKVGNLIPVGVNEGDTVLLPDYGGNGEFKIHNMQEERGVAIEVMNRGRLLEHKAVKDYKEKRIVGDYQMLKGLLQKILLITFSKRKKVVSCSIESYETSLQ